MNIKKARVLFFLSAAYMNPSHAAGWSAPQPGDVHNQGPIIIQNVDVYDGVKPYLQKNATLLIDYVRTPDRISGTGAVISGSDVGYFIKEIAINGKPLKTKLDLSQARTIDGKHKVLMPGLIDTHAHLSWANAPFVQAFAKKRKEPGSTLTLFDWVTEDTTHDPSSPDWIPNGVYGSKYEAKRNLSMGFTSIRETGGIAQTAQPSIDPKYTTLDSSSNSEPLKNRLILGQPGSRIWHSGSMVSATSGHADSELLLYSQFQLIDNPEKMTVEQREEIAYELEKFGFTTVDGADKVLKAVRKQLAKSADFIKIATGGAISTPLDPLDATTMDAEEVKAAVTAAKGFNTYVTTHAYTGNTVVRDVALGVRMIEHADLLNDAAARAVKLRENLKDSSGTNIGPWLGVSAFFDNAYANPKEGLAQIKQREVQQGTLKTYALIKKYGISHIAWGSDALFEKNGGEKSPKIIAHLPEDLKPLKRWENKKGQFVNYSYSNADILKMVTSNNGKVLTMSGIRTPYNGTDGTYLKEGKIGQITPGAVADLLIVEGNPLSSLDFLYDVDANLHIIMKDGVVYKNDGIIPTSTWGLNPL